MYKSIVILVCLLLTAHVNTQNCQRSSIRGMASGIISLGLPATPTTGASGLTYTQSLAGADLGLQA